MTKPGSEPHPEATPPAQPHSPEEFEQTTLIDPADFAHMTPRQMRLTLLTKHGDRPTPRRLTAL